MYESNDFDRIDEHLNVDHPSTCGCRDCDPDFYFDDQLMHRLRIF